MLFSNHTASENSELNTNPGVSFSKMSGFVVLKNGCWQWIGGKSLGYGYTWIDKKRIWAHRWTFGIVPIGTELHHTCENRSCVNPEHLTAITRAEHRKLQPGHRFRTHCRRGHDVRFGNVYFIAGRRLCKECQSMRARRYYLKKKARQESEKLSIPV